MSILLWGRSKIWQLNFECNREKQKFFKHFFLQAEKRELAEVAAADRAVCERAQIDIPLVPESDEDKKLAGLLRYSRYFGNIIFLN